MCNKVRAYPGDIVKRDGVKYFIRNHQFETMDGDVIRQKGKDIQVSIQPYKITVDVGDVVHRYLQEGDYVVLNRQPTLHSASMQAMRIKIMAVIKHLNLIWPLQKALMLISMEMK